MQPTLLALEGRQLLSTFTVNSTSDSGSGSGLTGDLRYCINQANSAGGVQTILFDNTVFNKPRTITLSGSQLELSDTTGTETITGPTKGVTVDGNNASRVFLIDASVSASLSGLTITGGSAFAGGGVANFGGTLTMTGCGVSGNNGVYGGGLSSENGGTTTLTNCTISGNQANSSGRVPARGGGIDCENSTLSVNNCTVKANTANGNTAFGGGIYAVDSTVDVENTTVTGNQANGSPSVGEGGGICAFGTTLTLVNTTVKGNKASRAYDNIFNG
jgi:hypothetical protein